MSAASVEQQNVVHVSEIFYVTTLKIETMETLLGSIFFSEQPSSK